VRDWVSAYYDNLITRDFKFRKIIVKREGNGERNQLNKIE
jgi:hypothetical protein